MKHGANSVSLILITFLFVLQRSAPSSELCVHLKFVFCMRELIWLNKAPVKYTKLRFPSSNKSHEVTREIKHLELIFVNNNENIRRNSTQQISKY